MPSPYSVRFHSTIPATTKEIFSYLSRTSSFERLTPPWEMMQLHERDLHLEAGAQTKFSIRSWGIWFDWLEEHVEYDHEKMYVDMQIKGPFEYWRHLHRFRQVSSEETLMDDFVRYLLPGSGLVNTLFRNRFRKRIRGFLRYRSRTLFNDLQVIKKYDQSPLHFVVAGARGFIGKHLCDFLKVAGHTVTTISRKDGDLSWDLKAKTIDPLPQCDVVINLAGENIASKRWSPGQKKRIRDSRIDSTRLLVEAINGMERKPRRFICASALGFYPSSDEEKNEEAAPGKGFLSQVCVEWEQEARKALCKSVSLRFGLVLSTAGGVLKKLKVPFLLSGGAIIGSGRQKVSWIELNELLYLIYHVVHTDFLEGPINCCAPEKVCSETLTRIVAKKLNRPTWLRIPGAMIATLFGQMGKETLLSSSNASSEKITKSGYEFAFPTLKEALRHVFP